jgi:glutathione S-transferase
MQLFYSVTSPYARKVRVMAMEKGLAEGIELVHCNPHVPDKRLLDVNPMSRIPTLVREGGIPLFDSPVICEWLDGLGVGPALIPRAGEGRWVVLRGQALADGMMDDAVIVVLERKRPESQQSPEQIEARVAALQRCADLMESAVMAFPGDLSLAHIAAGCALGYLDFRLPELDWRGDRTRLAEWFEAFSGRPSMAATRPDLPPP